MRQKFDDIDPRRSRPLSDGEQPTTVEPAGGDVPAPTDPRPVATTDNTITTPTTSSSHNWFSDLVRFGQALDDADLQARIRRDMGAFLQEDWPNSAHFREKLVLVICSLPIAVVAEAAFQSACRFLLVNMHWCDLDDEQECMRAAFRYRRADLLLVLNPAPRKRKQTSSARAADIDEPEDANSARRLVEVNRSCPETA